MMRSGRINANRKRRWPVLFAIAIIAAGGLIFLTRRPVVRERPMLPYGVLRVAVDASYAPFAAYGPDGPYGLDVDLARAAGEVLGVEVQFVNMGFDGLYDSLVADQADAVFSALVIDPLRTGEAAYTTPYFDAGQVLVRPAGSGIATMRDMDGRAVAVEYGSVGDVEARRWQRRLHELTIQPYDSPAAAVDAAQRGAVDAALVDAVSARLWLRDHGRAGLAIAPERVSSDPYAGAVRADNPRLLAALNAALETLGENGTLEAILERWL